MRTWFQLPPVRSIILRFLVDEGVDVSFAKDTQGRVVEMRALAGGQNGVAKKVR
jgi:hypothetical protein